MAKGNKQSKFSKVRPCGFRDMRQTDRQTNKQKTSKLITIFHTSEQLYT